MAYRIVIDPRAIRDIQNAIDYYEEQQLGIGERFETVLNKHLLILGKKSLLPSALWKGALSAAKEVSIYGTLYHWWRSAGCYRPSSVSHGSRSQELEEKKVNTSSVAELQLLRYSLISLFPNYSRIYRLTFLYPVIFHTHFIRFVDIPVFVTPNSQQWDYKLDLQSLEPPQTEFTSTDLPNSPIWLKFPSRCVNPRLSVSSFLEI